MNSGKMQISCELEVIKVSRMFDNWITWAVIGFSTYCILELLIDNGVLK